MDAGRKQVYFGCYQTSKNGLVQPIFPDRLVNVDAFYFSESNFSGVGRGWREYTKMQAQCSVEFIEDSEEILPDAKTMIKLAMRDFKSGKVVEAYEALPNYLRDQIAD